MQLHEVALESLRREVIPFEDATLYIYVDSNSADSTHLSEANYPGKSIGGTASVVKHTAHVPDTLPHLHIYVKGSQIGVLNIDGTGRDGSTGKSIPNSVADGIRQHFPNFRVPDNNIIEWAPQAVTNRVNRLLLEGKWGL